MVGDLLVCLYTWPKRIRDSHIVSSPTFTIIMAELEPQSTSKYIDEKQRKKTSSGKPFSFFFMVTVVSFGFTSGHHAVDVFSRTVVSEPGSWFRPASTCFRIWLWWSKPFWNPVLGGR